MKLGKIKISDVMLEDDNIDNLKILFGEFIPLHIEDRRVDLRCMIYTGYCDKFKDIQGELITPPFYDAIIDSKNVIFKI